MIDHLSPILIGTLGAATPLVLAGLGELIAERSGVMNLGVEGMMLIGAIAAFAAAVGSDGSVVVGLLAGMAAGVAASAMFALLALSLAANQAACGLALTIFGVGLSSFIGQAYVSQSLPGLPPLPVPGLAQIPLIGPVLFNQDPVVYLAFGLYVVVALVLARTRVGLILRAVGESPEAAHAIG